MNGRKNVGLEMAGAVVNCEWRYSMKDRNMEGQEITKAVLYFDPATGASVVPPADNLKTTLATLLALLAAMDRAKIITSSTMPPRDPFTSAVDELQDEITDIMRNRLGHQF